MEESPHELEDKIDSWVGRFSLWGSILLSTLATVIYCMGNPPDSEEVQRMRIFFRENVAEVSQFIKLPPEEMKKFAVGKRHPFYKSYLRASENEKKDINAQIHNSVDYRPTQYWFNAVFLWFICFTTIWFMGLMAQGVVNLVRQKPNLK
ncbi:MAG: hypothetical protein OEZ51_06470 [Nitrospinota bacterium]|nr:hypothetical protein [Nitrospinota bacterium]